ncbi:MAG: nickel-dependent lactate racemase, partial [Chloroflexota bacterium]
IVNFKLPYGQQQLNLTLDGDGQQFMLLEPNEPPYDLVRLALAAPIGSPRLREMARPGQSVAIVTSDITRTCPTHLLLPAVMDELAEADIRDEDVQVIFALGSHRAHTVEEQIKLAGREMAARLTLLDSDPRQTVYVGTTSRGTRIEAFKPVIDADFRIALGNVDPHYFAGYSGGSKALVPGVCSLATIQDNHAMMVHEQASIGVLEGNPVREDLEEGAALIGLDFILNVIVNADHSIIAAAAGHPVEAHRWLCQVLDYQRKVVVRQQADIVIVSAGGFPKDLSLYQAQKALDNAAAAVRPGGCIVWLAECPDGLGNPIFEEWLVGAAADDILARIQERFVLGGHKAAAIATVLKKASVILVSSLPPTLVEECGLRPYEDFDLALKAALEDAGPKPVIMVIPNGSAVLPATRTRPLAISEELRTK